MGAPHERDGVETALRWLLGGTAIAFIVSALLWLLLFHIETSAAGEAMGKALACEADARFAESLQRDVEEYRIPVINLLTERDEQVLDWLKQCLEAREPVRACVIRKCSGFET